MSFSFSPGNDAAWFAELTKVSTTTGAKSPLTTGTVTAFIATSNGPTATAANVALSVTCTYTGVNRGTAGVWTVAFSGTDSLTYAILNPLFGPSGTSPGVGYLIVTQTTPTAIRTYDTLTYVASREAVER